MALGDEEPLSYPHTIEAKPIQDGGSADVPPALTNPSSSLSSARKKPSIKEAKAFGLRCRPHRILDATQPSGYRLARIGEINDESTGAKAKLYNFFKTPLNALDEFGIGISLYFRQLMVMTGIFLLCGLISIPSIYQNSKFNPPDISMLARGSVAGAKRETFSLKFTAMNDFAVVTVLVLFALLSRYVGDSISSQIDEQQQTAQDYSICVENPPGNILDPDVYKTLFSRYGEVVTVTIALNNGGLLNAIAKKKEVESRLMDSIEGERLMEAEEMGLGINIEPSPLLKRMLFAFGLYEDAALLWRQREALKEEVQKALQHQSQHCQAKRVFVTFNTELAQRATLKDFYCGWFRRIYRRGKVHDSTRPETILQDRVLILDEAAEPSEIVWLNLRYRFWRRSLRFIISLCATGVLLLASYFSLEYIAGKKGSIVSAVLISLINMLLPLVVKILTVNVELPLTLSDQQQSILIKLVLARCMNTAVLMYIVTEFTETFEAKTMEGIMTILITDAVFSPALQILNIPQRLMQCFLAPRCDSQNAMNSYYQGLSWHLAERYTEISKTLFVSVFWSAILPTGFFVTSFALMMNYWSDKFALFNIWKRPPPFNSKLVILSRNFLSFTIFIHVVMSLIFFSNWPYSRRDEKVKCGIFFCRVSEAMTRQQRYASHFYSILSIVIFCVIVQSYLWGPAKVLFQRNFFVSGQGRAVDTKYRKVKGIAAYIPTVDVADTGHDTEKWLAGDVQRVPRKYLPLPRSLCIDQHNLCSKRVLPDVTERDIPRLFSTVRFYPLERTADNKETHYVAAAATEMHKASSEEGPAGLKALAQPLARLLSSQQALDAAVAAPGLPAAAILSNDIERESSYDADAPLPDGWDVTVDQTYVNLSDMALSKERPKQAASWNPFGF